MKKCLGVLMLLGLLFCVSAKAEEMIQVKGSDTMVNLVQSWAESFMGEHPDAFVAVTGGGSGTGIASLLNRTCDIAECSRKMKQEEIELARKKGINPLEWTVALDGLAVVVSAENPVDKLTINQLADIFTGRITNWKEVGGMDSKIVILSREVNSGTHVYFKEHVLRRGNAAHQDEFAVSALLMPSSQAIADEIAQNPQAIGYYGMGYVGSGQKAVAVAKDENSMYILPLIKNVINGEYAISRPLFMYTDGEPQGLVKEFLDFALSNEGQKIVLDLDFVPIKPVE
ncbi:MAG: phosphate ABC transporter substrate-binding protein [Candidatus Omnitrophota bacterium]